MSLSSSNLLQWIAQGRYLYKNFVSKLEKKYRYGTICEQEDKKMLLAYFYLEEIELYYNGCSCLTEETICKFIVALQKLLK